MERLREGPQTFFRLSPVDRAKASSFGLLRGNIDGRFDANYWRLTPLVEHRFAKPLFPIEPLGRSLTAVQYGSSALAHTVPVGVPILRMNNLQDDGWDLSDLKYIELSERELDNYRLEPGDILFNRTNSKELVGKCEVFREAGDWVFASYLIRVRTNEAKLLPQFASDFLGTAIGRMQIDRYSRQIIGMTNINAEEIKQLLVPVPDLDQQRMLVGQMNKARMLRGEKLAEAKSLLEGIDAFILNALGLHGSTMQRQTFSVSARDIRGSRCDADFHSAKFKAIREQIENGPFSAQPLEAMCSSILTGFAAGKQDQAFDYENGVPHLRPLNLDVAGHLSLEGTKFVPITSVGPEDWCVKGEVLFNNTNSTEMVGKSVVFDLEQPCACSNHMTRLLPGAHVSAEYLAALFNALRRIGYLGLLSTNFNNQAGINSTTLRSLRVPCPSLKDQEKLSRDVEQRRDQARQLHQAAESGWQAAKARFEEQLLGAINK